MEQAFYTCDAHLLRMDEMPQAFQPLDVPRTVVPLTIPPGRLDQTLGLVQSKGLFRDPEEIGNHPDGKAGPGICVYLGQGRPKTAHRSRFCHLKPMLYLDS
jgi:hypothetical protein